ncbi:MAG TPA: hypothetical protein RMI62_25420 [Polyangiaceae bacterium LLY-WYZ-15_(1-7)]|nr:hypothetical protein [Polyangiaceae bacterium LLY-WYZ-15_(1-7)]HJL22376.1 hypothetical protein [Polyangiaceae bacterium LLY-WYZ-15_(1-7)]HJL32452.1 hypothetical protein [Polyangiaceae bacterium LLY-WYZ-15_(1-7)]
MSNSLSNQESKKSLVQTITHDDGVQRAAAGVVVAAIVAVTKAVVFKS